MARYFICDMCGAHFAITKRLDEVVLTELNEVVFKDSTGYMDNAYDLCGECYHLLQNVVKSFAETNPDDVIKELKEIGF